MPNDEQTPADGTEHQPVGDDQPSGSKRSRISRALNAAGRALDTQPEAYLYFGDSALAMFKPWRLITKTGNPFYLRRIFREPGVYWLVWGTYSLRDAGFSIIVVEKRWIPGLWRVRYASHVPATNNPALFMSQVARFEREGHDVAPPRSATAAIDRLAGSSGLYPLPPQTADRLPGAAGPGSDSSE